MHSVGRRKDAFTCTRLGGFCTSEHVYPKRQSRDCRDFAWLSPINSSGCATTIGRVVVLLRRREVEGWGKGDDRNRADEVYGDERKTRALRGGIGRGRFSADTWRGRRRCRRQIKTIPKQVADVVMFHAAGRSRAWRPPRPLPWSRNEWRPRPVQNYLSDIGPARTYSVCR